MATYNGERYVGEQIESLQKQTYEDWRLWIHDDGSTDLTLQIALDFARKDKRIHVVEDGVMHLGVAKNFMHLLKYSDADYSMFCDQDDVWLPEKISTMLAEIQKKDNTQAQAVYSNAYLWSPEKGIISKRNTLYYPKNLKHILFQNTGIQGAAGIFNRKTKELLMKPLEYYAMHDHTLLLCVLTMGEVSYIDKPLMYYRQHTDNVTGNAPGSMRKKFMQMWQNRYIPVVSKNHLLGLEAFYKVWKDNLNEEDKQTIELFLSLPEKTTAERMHIVVKHGFSLYDSTLLILVKMCVRRFI